WDAFIERMEGFSSSVNDRVLEVREVILEEPVEVYDIEVEETNNFFVSDGTTLHSLCVHNSEFCWHDNKACNLASLNLRKFQKEDGTLDYHRMMKAVRVFITA